jgi:hypothetical protein
MQERELKAHIAGLLIAARHVVEAYGHASVREQKEAIDRLRRIVKNVEHQIATSAETVRPPDEVGPLPDPEQDLAKREVRYEEADRGRVAKARARPR